MSDSHLGLGPPAFHHRRSPVSTTSSPPPPVTISASSASSSSRPSLSPRQYAPLRLPMPRLLADRTVLPSGADAAVDAQRRMSEEEERYRYYETHPEAAVGEPPRYQAPEHGREDALVPRNLRTPDYTGDHHHQRTESWPPGREEEPSRPAVRPTNHDAPPTTTQGPPRPVITTTRSLTHQLPPLHVPSPGMRSDDRHRRMSTETRPSPSPYGAVYSAGLRDYYYPAPDGRPYQPHDGRPGPDSRPYSGQDTSPREWGREVQVGRGRPESMHDARDYAYGPPLYSPGQPPPPPPPPPGLGPRGHQRTHSMPPAAIYTRDGGSETHSPVAPFRYEDPRATDRGFVHHGRPNSMHSPQGPVQGSPQSPEGRPYGYHPGPPPSPGYASDRAMTYGPPPGPGNPGHPGHPAPTGYAGHPGHSGHPGHGHHGRYAGPPHPGQQQPYPGHFGPLGPPGHPGPPGRPGHFGPPASHGPPGPPGPPGAYGLVPMPPPGYVMIQTTAKAYGLPLQTAPRQRTSIACQYCRKRKIRCSGYSNSPDGQCQNCARTNQKCVFQPVQPPGTVASSRGRGGPGSGAGPSSSSSDSPSSGDGPSPGERSGSGSGETGRDEPVAGPVPSDTDQDSVAMDREGVTAEVVAEIVVEGQNADHDQNRYANACPEACQDEDLANDTSEPVDREHRDGPVLEPTPSMLTSNVGVSAPSSSCAVPQQQPTPPAMAHVDATTHGGAVTHDAMDCSGDDDEEEASHVHPKREWTAVNRELTPYSPLSQASPAPTSRPLLPTLLAPGPLTMPGRNSSLTSGLTSNLLSALPNAGLSWTSVSGGRRRRRRSMEDGHEARLPPPRGNVKEAMRRRPSHLDVSGGGDERRDRGERPGRRQNVEPVDRMQQQPMDLDEDPTIQTDAVEKDVLRTDTAKTDDPTLPKTNVTAHKANASLATIASPAAIAKTKTKTTAQAQAPSEKATTTKKPKPLPTADGSKSVPSSTSLSVPSVPAVPTNAFRRSEYGHGRNAHAVGSRERLLLRPNMMKLANLVSE